MSRPGTHRLKALWGVSLALGLAALAALGALAPAVVNQWNPTGPRADRAAPPVDASSPPPAPPGANEAHNDGAPRPTGAKGPDATPADAGAHHSDSRVSRAQGLPEIAPLHFALASTALEPEARQQLDQAMAEMRASSRLRLVLSGHTDERGTKEANEVLARARADEALQYLSQGGIARARLVVLSFGAERPLDPRSTPDAWARNRRVDLAWEMDKEPPQ